MMQQVEHAAPVEATKSREVTRRGRVIALVLATLAVIGAAVTYRFRPASVTVTPVVRGTAVEAIYATGTVEAEERVAVRAKTNGSVAELLVREGAIVRKDDVLARIDNPAASADLERGAAERGAASAMARNDSPQLAVLRAQGAAIAAELVTAKQDAERLEKLGGVVATAEIDRARARVAQLQATLAANWAQQKVLKIDATTTVARQDAQFKSLASRVADTLVRSPIDGVVLARTVNLGEVVTVNQVLFKVGDTRDLVLEVNVDEADVARVFDGRDPANPASEVAVSLYAFPKKAFHGRVFEILPDANRERKSFLTKVRLLDAPAGMRSGMTAEVNIIAARKPNALLVPAAAESDGKVWVVDKKRARRRAVTTGIRDLLRVEIEGGVSEGQMVIVEGQGALLEGKLVWTTVREAEKYLPLPDLSQPSLVTSK